MDSHSEVGKKTSCLIIPIRLVKYLCACTTVFFDMDPFTDQSSHHNNIGFTSAVGKVIGHTIDHRMFTTAFFAYARVMHGLNDLKALGVADVDDGPLQDCPICSDTVGKLFSF